MCNWCVYHQYWLRAWIDDDLKKKQVDRVRSVMNIDKPHPPWGPHVDIITNLRPTIPGIQQIRIGPDGRIISEEFKFKGGFSI